MCLLLALTGCQPGDDREAAPARTTTPASSPSEPTPDETSPEATTTPATKTPTTTGPATDTPTRTTPTTTRPPEFDVASAMTTVTHLAEEIGPRETTGPAYREAAAYVERQLRRYGYDVARQRVDVPAGNSWGVDVPAGTADNLIATTRGYRANEPHLVVGAHLDTVPQAPGAEDNASGVAGVLELARMASIELPPTPIVFIVFAAEEPRGEGDDLHHFGSRRFVGGLPAARRDAIVGMLSLDRIGAPGGVRIRNGGTGPTSVVDDLLAAAERLDVGDVDGEDNTASDHWSFEKAGVPAARLGGNAFAGYHSAADRVDQIDPPTLRLNGRIAWTWLTSIS